MTKRTKAEIRRITEEAKKLGIKRSTLVGRIERLGSLELAVAQGAVCRAASWALPGEGVKRTVTEWIAHLQLRCDACLVRKLITNHGIKLGLELASMSSADRAKRLTEILGREVKPGSQVMGDTPAVPIEQTYAIPRFRERRERVYGIKGLVGL